MKVGSLEIELLANMARLTADMAQARSTVGSAMGAIEKSVSIAKTALIGLGAVGIATAFIGGVKAAIDQADALNKLSQRTGVQVEQLSQLQYAAKLADVSNESLNTAFKKLNTNIAEGLAGGKEQVALFKGLGIQLTDTTGKAKSTDTVLLELADRFAKSADGAGKSAVAVKLMGKAGDEMIPMLNGGANAVRSLMQEADKLGLTISTDFARDAEEFNDNMTRLELSSKRLAISLASDVVTSLGKAAKAMADASIQGGKLHGIWAGLQMLFMGDAQHQSNVQLVKDQEAQWNLMQGMDKLRNAGHTADTLAMRSQQKQLDEVNARLKQTLSTRQAMTKAAEAEAAAAAKAAGVPKATIALPKTAKKEGKSPEVKELEEQQKLILELNGLNGSFLKDWDNLNKMFAKGAINLDTLQKAQKALLDKQPAIRAEHDLLKDAVEKEGEAFKKAAEEYDHLLERIKGSTDHTRDEARQLAEMTRDMGLTEEAIRKLAVAKTQDQAIAKDRLAVLADEIDWTGKLGDAYREQAAALRQLGAAKQNVKTGAEADLFNMGPGQRLRMQDQVNALKKAQEDPSFTGIDKSKGEMDLLRSVGIDPEQMTIGLNTQLEQMRLYYDQLRVWREDGTISQMAADQAIAQNRVRMNQLQLQGASDMFGALATLANSSNKKLSAIGKAAAMADATIQGILAVQKALASGPPPWNYITAAAVGIAAAANVAKIAGVKGFKNGGYTGDVGMNDVAGVTHGREFVVNAQATAKNRPVLEAMNSGRSVSGEQTIHNEFNVTNQITVTGTQGESSSDALMRAADTISKKTQADIMESMRMGGNWSKLLKAN
jgi:hypothetical protein